MKPGYFQATYWPESYWAKYWQEVSNVWAVPDVMPWSGAVFDQVRPSIRSASTFVGVESKNMRPGIGNPGRRPSLSDHRRQS